MKSSWVLGCCLMAIVSIPRLAVAQQNSAVPPQSANPPSSVVDGINHDLPSWLRFSGQVRLRGEGYTGGSFKPNNEDEYLLTRVWLNVTIQPASWLKFFAQGMDAHAPFKNSLPAGAPFRDTMDLRQGYVELGGMESSGFALRAGRQELSFGEERLEGPAPWLNTARSFDGAHGEFRRDGIRVDGFAVSVVKINQDQFDKPTPGNIFYGLYSSFTHPVPRATLEPYFFWKRQSGLKTEFGVPGVLNFGTYGVRFVGTLPHSFDYGTEMDKQIGSIGIESTDAWAGHWIAGYTVTKVRFTPRVYTEFNFASGDNNPTDNRAGTFNQLYPTAHDKYGLTDLVGWQNIKHSRTGIDLKLAKKWTFSGRESVYWLADSRDALYAASGAVLARSLAGTAGTYVGREMEFVTAYKFTPRAVLSGGFARLTPGTFLKNTTPGVSYNYPFLMMAYDF